MLRIKSEYKRNQSSSFRKLYSGGGVRLPVGLAASFGALRAGALPILCGLCLFLSGGTANALEGSADVRVQPLLRTTTSWNGAQLAWPAGRAELTVLEVTIAPGAETGWHEHPVPSFGVLLEGELEIRLRGGEVKRLRAGEALAEVVATAHNGRVVGDVPARLLVFYAGAQGVPLTVGTR